MQTINEKTDKFSTKLVVGDVIEIGGVHCEVNAVHTNSYDAMVITLSIVGATVKKRSKMTLIIPKGVPITLVK